MIWDLEAGKEIITVAADRYNHGITDCAFSPDASYGATARLQGIDLWEVETGTCIHSYRCPDEYPDFFINPKVLSCAFNADGTRVAGAIEGASVYIWDVATETFERQLRLAGGRKGVGDMQSVAFSPS